MLYAGAQVITAPWTFVRTRVNSVTEMTQARIQLGRDTVTEKVSELSIMFFSVLGAPVVPEGEVDENGENKKEESEEAPETLVAVDGDGIKDSMHRWLLGGRLDAWVYEVCDWGGRAKACVNAGLARAGLALNCIEWSWPIGLPRSTA